MFSAVPADMTAASKARRMLLSWLETAAFSRLLSAERCLLLLDISASSFIWSARLRFSSASTAPFLPPAAIFLISASVCFAVMSAFPLFISLSSSAIALSRSVIRCSCPDTAACILCAVSSSARRFFSSTYSFTAIIPSTASFPPCQASHPAPKAAATGSATAAPIRIPPSIELLI